MSRTIYEDDLIEVVLYVGPSYLGDDRRVVKVSSKKNLTAVDVHVSCIDSMLEGLSAAADDLKLERYRSSVKAPSIPISSLQEGGEVDAEEDK